MNPSKHLAGTILMAVATLAQAADINPAIVPTERTDSWWVDRHAAVLEQARVQRDAQLLLIGDSIT